MLCVVVVVLTNLVVVLPVNCPLDVDCRTPELAPWICLLRLARFVLATGGLDVGVVPDEEPLVFAIMVLGAVFPSTTTTDRKRIVLIT